MSPAIRAAREQRAQERLLAAAETLAGRFGLAEQHAALASARSGVRDALVAALFQREAIAGLLEAIVAASEPTAAMPEPGERLEALTAAEVAMRIDTMDAATLDDLARLEREGKQRKTVLAAIERRREQLAAEAEAAAEGAS